ncbi:MAG TPA: MFS transporter [Candidatus Thermoplasmatota archaeon]|nr:MFS transporter [Candidatus Thermoplasmatota archaeon]
MEQKLYRYRWAVVGIFWFVIFAYGANWFALSPMLKAFETQFLVPDWEAHLLISLIGMFVIFFAWPAGSLIDRKGPKLSISIGALFMALGFGLRPWLLTSFETLIISSVIAGIGLAWILVALAPQMFRWFPAKHAGLPVGIGASGLFIGFGTGSLCMPLLTPDKTSSQIFNGFLIFGVLAVIAFILWLVIAKDHPATPPEERVKIEKMRFTEGMKHVFSSKNAYIYPFIGFFIVGITLVISALLHQLYPGQDGGYIAGLLLYGCAIGAFFAPFLAKKIGLKKVTLSVVFGAVIFWLIIFVLNYYYDATWLLVLPFAFLFGICFQASWPLALYSQETENGVTESNVGIAASLYISISNIGAAVLPVIFPLLFIDFFQNFIAILIGLIICLLLWVVVKRK